MPPKKRSAFDATLPASERARRVMTALADDLVEVVALFSDVAEGRAPPVPLAASLASTAMELLNKAHAVVRVDHISPIEEKWLPDDVMRHVFEFAIGRRVASQFGAGGVVLARPVLKSGQRYRGHERIQTLRLVCKTWARAAGTMVFQLHVPARHSFRPAVIAAAFPNVLIVRHHYSSTMTKQQTARVSALYELYARARARPLVVDLKHTKVDDGFSLHGAYVTAGQPVVHAGIPAAWRAGLPFSVTIDDDLEMRGTVSMCQPRAVVAALTSRMPIAFTACSACGRVLLGLDNSVKYNVPSVSLYMSMHDTSWVPNSGFWKDVLSNADYWEHGMLPTVIFHGSLWFGSEVGEQQMAELIYEFIQAVGTERITFSSYGRGCSAAEWVQRYHAAMAKNGQSLGNV